MTISNAASTQGQPVTRRNVVLAAFVGALVLYLIDWINLAPGTPRQFLNSTDDMVRMVMVRDWLNGQSWFDPMLHRLGFEPGTVMHWSRLIDAPIGILVVIGNFFSAGNGERFAAMVWPFILFVIALTGMLSAVRRVTGTNNLVPTLIVGGYGIASWSSYYAGVIDHHNAQTALAIWLIVFILPSGKPLRDFTYAGIIIAIMLAVGIESLPLAIAGGLAIIVRLIAQGEALYEPVRRFGLTLAISIAVLFVALIGPQYYDKTYCDSLSLFHLMCAGIGGLSLYVILHPRLRERLPSPALTAPAIAGIVVVGLASYYFPTCLANPVSSIDPLLQHFWLDSIIEAQNVFQIFKNDPLLLIYLNALPTIAIGTIVWQLAKGQYCLINVLLLLFILVATATTLFQMRGVQQSASIAGLILSIATTRFSAGLGKDRPLLALGALIICCNFTWRVAVAGGMAYFNIEPGAMTKTPSLDKKNICRTADDLATLSALEPGFIAAANGLGAWLLFNTKHQVLSGPYHRNEAGNIASIKLMTGTEAEAHEIVKKASITIYAACPQFVDERQILEEVPNGFLSQLLAGKTPPWLEPITSTMDKPLKLWRVLD